MKLSPKILPNTKATAKAKAKEPEEGRVVAIGKEVWKDVHNQLAKLSKAGKDRRPLGKENGTMSNCFWTQMCPRSKSTKSAWRRHKLLKSYRDQAHCWSRSKFRCALQRRIGEFARHGPPQQEVG